MAVVLHDGHKRIKLNNFYVLGGTHAAGDERLQGHILLLLHPQPRPRRVAFLGLGTGISFSAIRFHPIQDALALAFRTNDVLSFVCPGVCIAVIVALPTRMRSPSATAVNGNLARFCAGKSSAAPV